MSTENRDARRRRHGPAPDEEGPRGVLTDGPPGRAVAGFATSGGVRG
ncbi:hypothetical protein [Halalkalicoccus ordinarius]